MQSKQAEPEDSKRLLYQAILEGSQRLLYQAMLEGSQRLMYSKQSLKAAKGRCLASEA